MVQRVTISLVDDFDPIPSWRRSAEVDLIIEASLDGRTDGLQGSEDGRTRTSEVVWGVPVGVGDGAPTGVDPSWRAPEAVGFTGDVGQTLVCQSPDGQAVVLFGVGKPGDVTTAELRSAAAAFARAAAGQSTLGLVVPTTYPVERELAAQVLVEGVLLARYDPGLAKGTSAVTSLTALALRAGPDEVDAVRRGAQRGLVLARATALARDLANSPPSLLTAERMADVARQLSGESGLEVVVYDEATLREMGCGGLLGVNAGSADPPVMVKLTYTPPTRVGEPDSGSPARLALVGKGIMYDSGGISLKPSDLVHATMKNDMAGAGAILAAMSVLRELDCPVAVTGFLSCTDNMPSGTATKLGDVLGIRGGTTVEVLNTDAEGRLVMADALVLAAEERPDAIVDIATLTGACLRALGPEIAGVFGDDQNLVAQVLAAADSTDEAAWQLPLAHRYRSELDSEVADISNMGGANGASIHAALFLHEFVDRVPWAHIDIAGTAQAVKEAGWLTAGCTGFGARLLAELAVSFQAPDHSGGPR